MLSAVVGLFIIAFKGKKNIEDKNKPYLEIKKIISSTTPQAPNGEDLLTSDENSSSEK